VNAGHRPRVHYQEDGVVSEASPILSDNVLVTKALRVQFLAIDPTAKNETGSPNTWTNSLTLRNRFNEAARTVELLVAPKGKIRYTLDGSEARNGINYTAPIEIGDKATTVYVFAECEGIEVKRNFNFAESGSNEVLIVREKPAQLYSPAPKQFDNAAETYKALKMAKDKNITFEQVTLLMGASPKIVHLTLGEMKIDAEFIETTLAHLQTLVEPDSPVVMKFKKLFTETGYDLEQFAKSLNIELENDEVIQE